MSGIYININNIKTNINNTHFLTYTYPGSKNIGQIWICPITIIYYDVFNDDVD